METNSTVKSRQQPTSRCLGGRSADNERSASSPSRANIAAAYRVSISLIRSGAMPFSAQSPSAQKWNTNCWLTARSAPRSDGSRSIAAAAGPGSVTRLCTAQKPRSLTLAGYLDQAATGGEAHRLATCADLRLFGYLVGLRCCIWRDFAHHTGAVHLFGGCSILQPLTRTALLASRTVM